MNDEEKSVAIERANAYREMMSGWAFKDLMNRIEEENRYRVGQLLTHKGSDNLLESTKGFNACVEFVKNELSFVTEFKK